jgi:hypothetical protein
MVSIPGGCLDNRHELSTLSMGRFLYVGLPVVVLLPIRLVSAGTGFVPSEYPS